MNHKIKVGVPVTKKGEVVGYEDVQEIPTNQVFNWNKRGYKAVPEGDVPAASTKKKKNKKNKKPKIDEPDKDLGELTLKELRVIAEPLGVTGKTKAALISAIEEAQQEPGSE